MALWCCSVFGGSIIFLICFSARAEEKDWRERFLQEASPAWQRYLDFCRKVQLRSHYVRRNLLQGQVTEGRMTLKQAEGAALLIHEPQSITHVKVRPEVRGTNSRYSFRLQRLEVQGPWLVAEITPGPDPELMEEVQKSVAGALRLGNLWLPDLIQDRDFHLREVRPEPWQGRSLVRVAFAYPKPVEKYPMRGALILRGGWALLDPEHDWTPVAYQVYSEEKGQKYYHEYSYQLGDVVTSHPLFIKGRSKVRERGLEVLSAETEFEMWEEEVPLEAFTLSAFGFPEPPLGDGGRPWYVWLAWGGILFLLLGLVCRWLLRRRAAGAG
jgi:hypothetical protein